MFFTSQSYETCCNKVTHGIFVYVWLTKGHVHGAWHLQRRFLAAPSLLVMPDLIKDGVFVNTVVDISTIKDGFRNTPSLTWFHIYMSPLRPNWTRILIVLSVWKLLCYQSVSPVEVNLDRTTVSSAKGRVHCHGSTTSASRIVHGTTAT